MTLLRARKSVIHRTLPSFFGIRKVGDNHSEAPQGDKTPASHNHFNSSLKNVGDNHSEAPQGDKTPASHNRFNSSLKTCS
jgi:hypothetical protein